MTELEFFEPKRVLAVVAHPDDVDFGAAATLARWIANGVEVHLCVVTNGDLGGFDRGLDRSTISSIRQEEQTQACRVYGLTSIEFLGHLDGCVEPSLDLRRDIARAIRATKPDTVLCQSPERNYERIGASHPDHLAAGEATLRSVYPDSRNPFAFPELVAEGLEPHVVRQVFMMAGPQFNYVSEITAFFTKKIEALLEHKSQLPEPENLAEVVESWATDSGQRAGLPEGQMAELFYAIKTG